MPNSNPSKEHPPGRSDYRSPGKSSKTHRRASCPWAGWSAACLFTSLGLYPISLLCNFLASVGIISRALSSPLVGLCFLGILICFPVGILCAIVSSFRGEGEKGPWP
jgi:hypothetical protein